ncbi:MAG TPA: division/cell wall cluster transcriptional repressor MraZ [Chitinophagales bacterium]|nr:division/cell wall cluster transcriptional repressor MraZ [Chitinophagales bacterium]HLP52361.1 division/cell wall cluster transcriptional repressor MraZ [Chitinophagales bacterium]
MNFLGQFECTMDDKGRVKLPAVLRKQFPAGDGSKFMLAKDIEDCLVIYPMKTWAKTEATLQKLHPFNTNHQKFINAVTTGLTEVDIDSADRFLVNTTLKKYLGTSKDIVLKGKFDRIQVWDAVKYEAYTNGNVANMQQLADEAAKYLEEKDGLNIG